MAGGVVGIIYGLRSKDDGASEEFGPTAEPSQPPSMWPSAPPSQFSIDRFEETFLPEYSRVEFNDTDTPQSRAFEWLANNTNLDSYSNGTSLDL